MIPRKTKREKGIYEENIERIKKLALAGKNAEEIAQSLGRLLPRTIETYARKEHIPLPRLEERSRIEKIKAISYAIENGAQFNEDIAKSLRFSPRYCYNLSRDSNLPLLPFRDTTNRLRTRRAIKRNFAIDELICDGELDSLRKIGDKVHLSHEHVRQYLVSTSQYNKWHQAIEKRKQEEPERKNAIGIVLSQLLSVGQNLFSQVRTLGLGTATEREQWAYEKTQEYYNNRRRKSNKTYNYQRVFSLFEDYYTFQHEGRKVPLDWFAEKYGLWTSKVGRILKDVGLKPLIKGEQKERVVTPSYKKECLERAVEIPMPSGDIAYFLDVDMNIVSQFFCTFYTGEKERPSVKKCIKQFGLSKGNRATYRAASQIYEARDAGFSEDDVRELYALHNNVIEYSVSEREIIEQHIIASLQQLFPDKKVTKPYVTFKRE